MRIVAQTVRLGVGCCAALAAAAQGSFIYTQAARFEPRAAFSGAERFPEGARLMLHSGGAAHPLAAGFALSADASVSFDGTRLLFAGKKSAADPWSIWEAPLAGGTPRRVSTGSGDCIRPHYLPRQRVVYARGTPAGFQVETAALDGTAILRLTYTRGHHIPSGVLRDGRVLFEAPHPGAGGPVIEIFAVYTDGSGVEAYRCDHGSERYSAAQLLSGDIIFQTGARLARFTSARATQLDIGLPPADYTGPVAEAGGGEWLVNCRTSPGAASGLCRVTPDSARPPVTVVKGGAFQPVRVAARAAPPAHPSSLGGIEGAVLLCLNAYAAREGRIPPDTIAKVRVWSQRESGEPEALGESAVDADGSFFLRVPSERPLRFELLDRAGRSVRAGKDWYWMRKGEQRVCVGCHVGPERAPENIVPGVLLRTQTPASIGVAAPAPGSNGGR